METPDVPELPPRPPRPFLVHWAVTSAIAVLVVLFPALLLGWNLMLVAVCGGIVGLFVAPTTHRREVEALARRRPPTD